MRTHSAAGFAWPTTCSACSRRCSKHALGPGAGELRLRLDPQHPRDHLVEPVALPRLELTERQREHVQGAGALRRREVGRELEHRLLVETVESSRHPRASRSRSATRRASSSSTVRPEAESLRDAGGRGSTGVAVLAGGGDGQSAASIGRSGCRSRSKAAARTRVGPHEVAHAPRRDRSCNTWEGSRRNGSARRVPDRLGQLGQRALEHARRLEEPPRADVAVAEEGEESRRRARVPRAPARCRRCPSQSSRPPDGRAWAARQRGLERDDERVLVGWIRGQLDLVGRRAASRRRAGARPGDAGAVVARRTSRKRRSGGAIKRACRAPPRPTRRTARGRARRRRARCWRRSARPRRGAACRGRRAAGRRRAAEQPDAGDHLADDRHDHERRRRAGGGSGRRARRGRRRRRSDRKNTGMKRCPTGAISRRTRSAGAAAARARHRPRRRRRWVRARPRRRCTANASVNASASGHERALRSRVAVDAFEEPRTEPDADGDRDDEERDGDEEHLSDRRPPDTESAVTIRTTIVRIIEARARRRRPRRRAPCAPRCAPAHARSLKTRAVIPTLVAASAAPRKMATFSVSPNASADPEPTDHREHDADDRDEERRLRPTDGQVAEAQLQADVEQQQDDAELAEDLRTCVVPDEAEAPTGR